MIIGPDLLYRLGLDWVRKNMLPFPDLDIRTVIILVFLGNLTNIIILAAYSNRSVFDQLKMQFIFSKICQAFAWFLLAERGIISDFFSVYVGNSVLSIGFALEALLMLSLEHRNWHWQVFYTVMTTVCVSAFWFFANTPNMYVVIASMNTAAIFSIVAYHFLRYSNWSRLRLMLGSMYTILCVFLLFRAWNAFGNQEFNLLSANMIQNLAFTMLFIQLLVGSIGFLMLMREQMDLLLFQSNQNLQNALGEEKAVLEALHSANEQLSQRVQEVEKLEVELRQQALRDPLTGLYNRRFLNEALKIELLRAERDRTCLSIIICDIDHFKNINDTYGHQVGDKFLVEIARELMQNKRNSDIACRQGGEEFLLVYPGVCLEQAAERAEKLRQKCAEIVILHEGQELKTTLSFGTAGFPAHGGNPDEIIIKADKAMYQSKHAGRNQVTVWTEPIG